MMMMTLLLLLLLMTTMKYQHFLPRAPMCKGKSHPCNRPWAHGHREKLFHVVVYIKIKYKEHEIALTRISR
jgi:hypothetical protein